ncbi:SAM-dependent methyltransferase [Aminobacter aganoensis]|uniref:Methyltransferase domain-containing protein n=1 Tax=Aminobacter aganoensis TaxID=83264 RepID=A0A7X0FB91_9HYPH|nr:SAM-dependent methyltransferase [Aminobacter aganoensis]MBB6356500.1 hypothetical protein [Aminobacter aganoensis]
MDDANTKEAIERTATGRADPYANRNSRESRFRANRFKLVQEIMQSVLREKGRCTVLDLGGTERYWDIGADFIRGNEDKLQITLLNTDPIDVKNSRVFASIQGSATDKTLLQGQQFDFVHSNSVIEHVGQFADMKLFADNVRRLAARYYIQTPNYWFPYEPHFRFLGFQYLPERLRIEMLHRFALGFFSRQRDWNDASWLVRHHRLLSASQMKSLFPDAEIAFEKVMSFNKSIIAVR